MKVRRGNGGKHSSSVSSETTSDSLELEEALEFPEYSSIDHRSNCPKYASVVDGKLDTVSLEDIDPLQLELETLLVCVVQRKQHLRAQLEALDHDDSLQAIAAKRMEGKHKTMPPSPSPPASSSKRSRPSTAEQKSTKRMKEQRPKKSGLQFGIEVVTESISTETITTSSLVKNDTPNRFWSWLDEYCRDLTEEQIQVVEDMLEAQEAIKTSDYVKVPPLGKHYTIKWAQEDLLEEQKEASPDGTGNLTLQDIEKLLRKSTKESLSDERYGSLTQRLVSCLIEDNLLSRTSEELAPVVSNTSKSSASNMASIEQRIRKELEELGVMEALAEKVAEQDDEIFLELRKCQSQLLTISGQNVRMLRKLVDCLKRRRAEQEAEKRLRAIDVEVMEHFRRRRASSRPSRTSSLALAPPTKKEREQLQSLLLERKAIIAQLTPVDHRPFASP